MDEIGRATSNFPGHWGTAAAQDNNDSDDIWDKVDSALKFETGYRLNEWIDVYAEIWKIGSELEGSVKELECSELIRRIDAELNWGYDRVGAIVGELSLSQRGDFLKPESPYKPTDVYPWRFGRSLSYIRRPLIVRALHDGEHDLILWGNRHLLHSAHYLVNLLMSGRYKAVSKDLKELSGKLNKRRGDRFNDAVAATFEAKPGLKAKARVRKIKGKPLGLNGEYGDIDVLVADPENRLIKIVECNDLAVGRAPHELEHELKSLFKGTGSRTSKVDKLLSRTEWCRDNLNLILEDLDLDPDKRWTVKPLVVVDEEVFSPHIFQSAVEVISLRELGERMEPTRSK